MLKSIRTPFVRIAIASGALVLALSATGAATSTTAAAAAVAKSQKLQTVNVAVVAAGGTAALLLGDSVGIFRRNGIHINFVTPAPSSPQQIPALLNGQVDISAGALTTIIAAQSNGIPVKVLAASGTDFDFGNGKTYYGVMVRQNSPIQRFRDLAGKTIGVSSVQSVWDMSLKEAVAKDGGDPSGLNVVQVPFPDQIAALNQGRVDAIFTAQPFVTVASEQGNRNIGDAEAFALGTPKKATDVEYTTTKWLQKNPKTAKAFLAAIRASDVYANAHPDEVRSILVQDTTLPSDLVAAVPILPYGPTVFRSYVVTMETWMLKYGLIHSIVPLKNVIWSRTPTAP